MINELNAQKVRAAKLGMHADGRGLYLQVTEGGKSWIFRFYSPVTGKRREMGLGSAIDVTLSEARIMAADMHKLVATGTDPVEQRAAQRAERRAKILSPTLEECSANYVKHHGKRWSWEYRKNWINAMDNHVLPTLGHVEVSRITSKEVCNVIKPVWDMTNGAKFLRQLFLVLTWATEHGYRSGDNPAAFTTINMQLGVREVKKVEHSLAIPWRDTPEFMADLRSHNSIAARAAEFAVLTAARQREIRKATWAMIKPNRTWVCPPEIMKGREEHIVPLNERAVEILYEMKAIAQNHLIFPGINHKTSIREMHKIRTDVTAHGFRTTIYDWARNATDYPDRMMDVALAHKVPEQVKRAYCRPDMIDKRRVMMEHWGRFCAGIDLPEASNVVPLDFGTIRAINA